MTRLRIAAAALVLIAGGPASGAATEPAIGADALEAEPAAGAPHFPTPAQRPPPPPFNLPFADVVTVDPPTPRAASVDEPSVCAAGPRLAFETPVRPDTEIVVAAVGDILLHARLQRQAFAEPEGFVSLWAEVADILAAADIAYANLEGSVAADIGKDGNVVATPVDRFDDWVYSSYPMFNYHPDLAGDLRQSGFDVVSTANNHSLDRFAIGADRTIEALNAAGIAFTGTRPSDRPDHPWHTLTRVGDRTLAWLACTYSTNGIPDRAGQVLLCYEQEQLVHDTIRALADDPDIEAVILTPHWGVEYVHAPRPEQVALAHAAIEAGALAVIGSHPHVVQPWERHVASDGREGLILYSLGNFVSGQRELPRRTSLILLFGLAETLDGRLAIAGVRHVPLRMTSQGGAGSRLLSIQATERVGAADAAAHLATLLEPGNIHPADAALTTLTACDAARSARTAADATP